MPAPRAGLLTAGTWDDNLNYDFYLRYLAKNQLGPGVVSIAREDRLEIKIIDGAGKPMTGAEVMVGAENGRAFRSITGADGRVYFFPRWSGLKSGDKVQVTASYPNQGTRTADVMVGTRSVALGFGGELGQVPTGLDLALVIDTTGSMGDEIKYLQTELETIVGSVAKLYPNVSRRFGLVAYKDEGDEYVVRTTPFTSDLTELRTALGRLSAGGGGDYPEAPDRALTEANTLAWRGGATARALFWVADAPHHAGKERVMIQAFTDAVTKGIHIYPVAASGTDDLTEDTMRTAAEVTGGRYLFLTDDSGVGGAHKEPRIPCYFVTSLQAAMRRMLETELSGTYVEPAREDVIRTGGDPQNRLCKLSDGQELTAF